MKKRRIREKRGKEKESVCVRAFKLSALSSEFGKEKLPRKATINILEKRKRDVCVCVCVCVMKGKSAVEKYQWEF